MRDYLQPGEDITMSCINEKVASRMDSQSYVLPLTKEHEKAEAPTVARQTSTMESRPIIQKSFLMRILVGFLKLLALCKKIIT